MIFRRFIFASAAAATLVLSATAIAAQTYVMDARHSEVRFAWSHFGVSKMSGMILNYSGRINFDPASPENSKLEFTGKVDSLWTHVEKLDEHLKGPQFFEAAKFPEITFKSTKVEKTGETTGKITGDLTIKGVTKPVTLDVELNFKGLYPFLNKPALGFSAKTTINRSDFGITKGIPAVSDEIRITIETEMQQG